LATNRNGGMLRLIAPRHDDDDDEIEYWNSCFINGVNFLNRN